MSTKKPFVVKHGLDVADNLIFAENQKVGIQTSLPDYTLDVDGSLGISGGFYVPTVNSSIGSTSGIASGTSLNFISGIDTTGLLVGDYITGTFIQNNTRIISIGSSSLGILPNHTNTGLTTVTFSFQRYKFSGEAGQTLVSRGNELPPIWTTQDAANASTATTAINVIGGIASVTQLDVSGISTLGFVTATDINVSGSVTATNFYGNLVGIASVTQLYVSGVSTLGFLSATDINVSGSVTATNFYGNLVGTALTSIDVIGGIASVTQLDVSGVSTFTSGIFSGSTSTDLVRITQTGSGNALRVEDSTNPDLTSFIIDADGQVGIKTSQPNYDLDVKGTILIGDSLYVEGGQLSSRVGILSGTDRSIISGIDTTGIEVSDFVDDAGTVINPGTIVTSVGLNTIGISPDHNRFGTPISVNINIERKYYAGLDGEVLVSRGSGLPPNWSAASNASITNISTTTTYYPTFVENEGRFPLSIGKSKLAYIPDPGNLGIGSTVPTERLDVGGNVKIAGSISGVTTATVGFLTATDINVSGTATVSFLTATNVSVAETVTATTVDALTYFGDGINLSGIVTQITAGIGVRLSATETPGKGIVNIDSYFPIGKTIFVTQNGNDTNSGLTENDSKRTIKAAAAIAFPGDTIKVYPGVYVENNPIQLSTRVSVEGTELRNCIVTPRYVDRDLFHVNNSCHVTDLSFISANDMTDGAAIIALQPLLGVSTDRFFDAARMIRYNLDYIAKETVGYLTSTDYKNPAFVVVDGSGNPTAPVNCSDDIKDVMKAVIHDITRGGNLKCVGAGKSYFDDAGTLLHITGTDTNGYSVKEATIEALNYAAGIARSCINNVSWTGNYQTEYSQVKDLAMQADAATGSNEDIGSCANVVSAIYSCVGVVTTIIDQGLSVLGSGINTTFPANSGIGTDSIIGVTSAVYDNVSGETTIIAPTLSVKEGDIVEVRDLLFDCTSGGSIGTQRYPSGRYGYLFDVIGVSTTSQAFTINTGISTIPHNYVGGGYVVNRAIGVTTASYDNATGITTITAPGAVVKVGQFVKLHDLEFSCTSGAGTTTLYPTGNLGYDFRVTEVIGSGTTFVVNVGPSTIPHTYESGGVVFPPYSPGVGPITQGPYIRNCTNFVPKSIGMKVDGFEAEPGDQDDIGVTGTMSVDSYTQYNQGGIGVSITNGAYSQLVSIFTICDDIAIYTASGGQCDITNSNSSFGRLGLVSKGVGDYDTKSIYHYTGVARTDAEAEQAIIEVSGIGNLRPYDGQTMHFGELYYEVQSITVDNGGFGYTQAPVVTIDSPTGPNGIRAEASANINSFGQVTSIDIISAGSQYRLNDNPQITIAGPTGAGTTAEATLNLYPIYYTIESATLPSAGISTVILNTNLNNTVSAGTTVYFNRLSLQITSSHSFEWVGSGNDINLAKPALGGVVIPENEVVKLDGGEVVYTSTDQAGNFRIGDGLVVNQLTGTVSGRAFNQSLLNTVTPLIIALGN